MKMGNTGNKKRNTVSLKILDLDGFGKNPIRKPEKGS
jgi:hypothetical protein